MELCVGVCIIQVFWGGNRFNKDYANGEDLLFNLKMATKNTKIGVVKEYFYNYFQRLTSAVHNISEKTLRDHEKMAIQALSYVEKIISMGSYQEYSMRLYELCVLDRILQRNYKDLLKQLNHDKRFFTMNSRSNYKIRIKNEHSFKKKILIFLIHKKAYSLIRFLLKLKMRK